MGRNPFMLFTNSLCLTKGDMNELKRSVAPRVVPSLVITTVIFILNNMQSSSLSFKNETEKDQSSDAFR
jgi:hypothetical protein